MGRMTERDMKAYNFLVKTRLPINSCDLAKMFYQSPTGNEMSSLIIAQRRMRVLKELQYIEISPKKFGSSNYYYVGKVNEKSLRHRLLMSHVIATIATSGFEVVDIQVEKRMPEKYSIISDIFLLCKYNQDSFYLIIEVDLTKEFNEECYEVLIKDLQNNKLKFKYPVLIMSVSDFKLKSDFIKSNVIQLNTQLSNFNKLLFNFIK